MTYFLLFVAIVGAGGALILRRAARRRRVDAFVTHLDRMLVARGLRNGAGRLE